MNNLSSFSLSFSILVLSICSVRADLVAFPTGDAAWTVDVAPSTSPSAPKLLTRQVTRAEVTQIDKVKRIQLTWSDGKTTEKWSMPNLPVTFEEDPRNGGITPYMKGDLRASVVNLSFTYDSSAFDWVTPDCLKEKDPITYEGKQCYHYVGKIIRPVSKVSVKYEAWIDATTLLPVALDNSFSLSTYKFQPKPPVGPLVMPPAFQKSVQNYKLSAGYP